MKYKHQTFIFHIYIFITGKLAVGRGVGVNVNALLPTSKWSKPNPKMVKTGEMTLDDNKDDNSNSISTPILSNLLSVTKVSFRFFSELCRVFRFELNIWKWQVE